MPEIFVSYRRADTAATAGRLFDRLSEHFGPDQVFRDIDTIEAGDNFERTITNAHYLKLLVVLLHQAAVVHVVLLTSMTLVIFGLDLASRNIFPEVIAEFMNPGQSMQGGFEAIRGRLLPVTGRREFLLALLLATIVSVGGAGWLVASSGAYRDAFERSCARSIAAFILAILIAAAAVALIALLY